VFDFEHLKISGENLISVTKVSKLSFFIKKCFQEIAITGLETYVNQFWPMTTGELTALPRLLAGGEGSRFPSPRTPPRLSPWGLLVSDIAIFVLKRKVKLQLTNLGALLLPPKS